MFFLTYEYISVLLWRYIWTIMSFLFYGVTQKYKLL